MSCSTVSTWRRDAAETRIGSAVCPPALAGARANFRCSCVSDAQIRVRIGVVAERMLCFAPATQDRFQRRIFRDALAVDIAVDFPKPVSVERREQMLGNGHTIEPRGRRTVRRKIIDGDRNLRHVLRERAVFRRGRGKMRWISGGRVTGHHRHREPERDANAPQGEWA